MKKSTLVLLEQRNLWGPTFDWLINEYQNGPGGTVDSHFCLVKINGTSDGNDGLTSFALADFDFLNTDKNDANYPEGIGHIRKTSGIRSYGGRILGWTLLNDKMLSVITSRKHIGVSHFQNSG